MSITPKLQRILLPPTLPPSSVLGPKANTTTVACHLLAAQTDLNTATSKKAAAAAAAASESNNNNNDSSATPPLQRHVTLHPSQPLIGYVLNPVDVSIASSTSKMIVVQHTITKQIIFSISWIDLAACVYGETDVKKLSAAAKTLGIIQSMQFYDPSILFWSRLMTTTSTTSQAAAAAAADDTTTSIRFQALAVQTDKRVMLLNLRKGPTGTQVLHTLKTPMTKKSPYRIVLAHFSEKSIGALPSSNILPLTDRWVLIGCVDGSMKCYDWTTGSTVKKIKGLGKGDWIVKLLSANRFHADPTSLCSGVGGGGSSSSQGSSSGGLRRILTVTKKGIVYLIELEIDLEKNTMDIQPPLGRFYIGSPVDVPPADAIIPPPGEKETAVVTALDGPIMEHTIISYDAHMDRLLWLTTTSATTPKTTTKQQSQTLSVWNLKALQHDFLQQASLASSSGNSSKNLFKPDPSLVIQFPTTTASSSSTAGAIVTVAVLTAHPAFSGDTVVCATVSNTGDLFLHGAVGLAANTTQTVQATPVLGINLTQVLGQAIPSFQEQSDLHQQNNSNNSNNNDNTIVRVHAACSQPLPSSGCSDMLIATNMGLLLLEFPSLNNKGSHHFHFGAGLGSLGKSILLAQNSSIEYGSVDALTGNPVGLLEPKGTSLIYESPTASNMPPEFQKRPFRNPPTFLVSPSGMYVALFWPTEFRYEILHVPTVLQRASQRGSSTSSNTNKTNSSNINSANDSGHPVIASGTGISDFAWIGDEDDVFSLLHAEDLMEQAALSIPKMVEDEQGSFSLAPNLTKIGSTALNVANLTKSATSGALNATKMATMGVTKGATSAANKTVGVATQGVRVGAKVVSKGVKKSFKMFGVGGGKKKKGGGNDNESNLTADDDEDDSENAGSSGIAVPSAADLAALEQNMKTSSLPQINEVQQRYVELKRLKQAEGANTSEMTSLPAASSVSLGTLSLRGGKRNIPTTLFGGPVLCVATREEEDQEGQAYFYTRKKDEKENNASVYTSSGPTLPYPDHIVWDDDGRVCAVVIESRVAIYLSNEPDFVLLGTVRISSPSNPVAEVTSARFVHDVLYCCTWNSVHCVLLGNLDTGLCKLDTFLLASTDVPMIPRKLTADDKGAPFLPFHIPLPLVQPKILGYQSGSLIVSTLRGVQAVPLNSVILRIGLLLAAGQMERASNWFNAVSDAEHETLASFLERRGHPEVALQLPGLSLETIIDMSMRFGYVDRLEEVVETYGVSGLRAIDMGRGVSPSIFGPDSTTHSIVVCVGAYLLAHGRVELTRRIATECLRSGEEGKKDAFFLGTLLLPVDESDASRLISRAVEEGGAADDWLMGKFVRDFVLSSTNPRT